jgi:hypothetical protein
MPGIHLIPCHSEAERGGGIYRMTAVVSRLFLRYLRAPFARFAVKSFSGGWGFLSRPNLRRIH